MLSVLSQAEMDLRKFKASLSCIVSFRTARLPGENLSQKKKWCLKILKMELRVLPSLGKHLSHLQGVHPVIITHFKCLCAPCAFSAHGDQKRAVDSLELE